MSVPGLKKLAKKGFRESVPDQKKISKIREEIDEVKRDLDAASSASISRSEAVARIQEFVANQASAAVVDVRGFAKQQKRAPTFDIRGSLQSYGGSANLVPFLCKIFPDVIQKLFSEELDGIGIEFGPAAEDRETQLHALRARLLSLESEEEALVESLEAAGHPVERRADISNPLLVALKDRSKAV